MQGYHVASWLNSTQWFRRRWCDRQMDGLTDGLTDGCANEMVNVSLPDKSCR